MELRVNNVNNYTPNFQARSKTIRVADDLARLVNKNFPLISSTKLHKFKHTFLPRFDKMHERINNKISNSRMLQGNAFMKNIDDFVALEEYNKVLKTTNAGNCGELSMVAFVMAKLNNINNAKIVSMRTSSNKSLDHAVVIVNDKKPYIIDAWLGFADYVPNAIQRYKSEFCDNFERRLLKSKKIKFVQRDTLEDFIFNGVIDNDFAMKKLKNAHPEWILNSTKKFQLDPQSLK